MLAATVPAMMARMELSTVSPPERELPMSTAARPRRPSKGSLGDVRLATEAHDRSRGSVANRVNDLVTTDESCDSVSSPMGPSPTTMAPGGGVMSSKPGKWRNSPRRLRVVARHLSPAETMVEAVVEPLLGAAEGRSGHMADQDGIDGVFEAGVQQANRQPRVLVIVSGAAAVARRLRTRPAAPAAAAGPAAALLQPLVRGSSPSSSTRPVPLSLSGGSMA